MKNRAKQILTRQSGVAMAILMVVLVVVMALLAALLASSSALLSQADVQVKQDRAQAQAYSFGQVVGAMLQTDPADDTADSAALRAMVDRFVDNYPEMDNDPYANGVYWTVPLQADSANPDGCGTMSLELRKTTYSGSNASTATGLENRNTVRFASDYYVWVSVVCQTPDGATATDTAVYRRSVEYKLIYHVDGVQYYYNETDTKWYKDPNFTQPYSFSTGENQTEEYFAQTVTITQGETAGESKVYRFDRRERL